MSTNICRAKNPATCRTHGSKIRAELQDMSQVFSGMPEDYTKASAMNRLERLNRFDADSLNVAKHVIEDTFNKHAHFATVVSYQISGALSEKVTAAKGELANHKFDFSTYPGDTLAAGDRTAANSKGWYDRNIWLRDHGVVEDAPDTTFGTAYVYCSSHRRAHTTGWCTVSIVNKAPLTADSLAAATAEARAKNFRITGDPEPVVETPKGPAPLYGVGVARAQDNNRWIKTLPENQQAEVMRLVRNAKKKDVLMTIENYRTAHENAVA